MSTKTTVAQLEAKLLATNGALEVALQEIAALRKELNIVKADLSSRVSTPAGNARTYRQYSGPDESRKAAMEAARAEAMRTGKVVSVR